MSVLTAFYDLAHGPVSFDFVTWLVRAMKERDDRGWEGLHVVIVPKEDGLGGFSRHWGKHDEKAARWRLWHIILAACPLAGASVTLAASRAHAEQLRIKPCWWPEGRAHFLRPLVQASRDYGEDVPILSATAAARAYIASALGSVEKPLATLTLRNQTTDPDRNDDPGEWLKLLGFLSDRFGVVVLQDTHAALSLGQGYAEFDPDLRLALYERAALNVIGNNGPSTLLHFSRAPFVQFGVGLGEWKAHYEEHLGLKTGEQLPWATPLQRLVYRPATFEVMREEIERWASATT